MQITLKLFRYNPEKDRKPHYETYQVEAQPTDRVLDLLEYVKGHLDGSLSFRRSCAHGVCGSDAMRINGRNRLACKVLVKDLKSSKITVEPLLGLRVIKDMIILRALPLGKALPDQRRSAASAGASAKPGRARPLR